VNSKKHIIPILLFLIAISAVSCGNSTAPRMVVVGRTDCVPCREMMELVDGINSESENTIAKFISVDDDNSPISKYDIGTLPTSIFFDSNGKEYHRQIKAMTKEDVLFWLNKENLNE